MFQEVSVIGRLGGDAEVRHTTAGTSVANFSVAVSEKYKEKEHVEWFRCVLFGKLADSLSKFIRKGDLIHVTGRLKTREYEGKYYTDLNVEKVTLLGKKNDRSDVRADDPDIPF